MHDLAALVLHFHFFPGVASIEKGIDMGEDIEGNRVGINLCHCLATAHGRLDLLLEFLDRTRTTAGDSLITGSKDTAQTERAVQRMERHQRDRSCAIRIRNHSTICLLYTSPSPRDS